MVTTRSTSLTTVTSSIVFIRATKSQQHATPEATLPNFPINMRGTLNLLQVLAIFVARITSQFSRNRSCIGAPVIR